jgi:hypothetical protein
MSENGRVFISQGYPLWIELNEDAKRRLQALSGQDLVRRSKVISKLIELDTTGPYCVIGWEVDSDHLPIPIVPEIGEGTGHAITGLSAADASANVEKYLADYRELVRGTMT